MKWICSVVIGTFVTVGGLLGQSPPTATADTGGQKAAAPGSNQQANIEAYVELLRSEVRKSKSQIVGEVMQLDTAQAAKFWPIYQQFEADYKKIGYRIFALVNKYVENYDQMTDGIADQLANEVLAVEDKRNDLKKQYYQKFKEATDAITATRFLQVENQLERVADLQVASQLPVVSGGEDYAAR